MWQRLTRRRLLQFLGFVPALTVAFMWFTHTPLPIQGSEQDHEPLLVIFGILGGLFLAILEVVGPRFISDQPVFQKSVDQPIPESTRQKNRQKILELVEKIWIKGFLDHVLNEMESLQLDLAFAEPEKVLQRNGMADFTLPDNRAIRQVFGKLGGKLVILGEPGAGKTVLLLQLARELITEAIADTKQPIPMVLALSSWAATQPPFEAWLRQEIRDRYGQWLTTWCKESSFSTCWTAWTK